MKLVPGVYTGKFFSRNITGVRVYSDGRINYLRKKPLLEYSSHATLDIWEKSLAETKHLQLYYGEEMFVNEYL